ncbi:MAG: L,D-transpeptidase [Hyphomicrobiaceae bacterium]
MRAFAGSAAAAFFLLAAPLAAQEAADTSAAAAAIPAPVPSASAAVIPSGADAAVPPASSPALPSSANTPEGAAPAAETASPAPPAQTPEVAPPAAAPVPAADPAPPPPPITLVLNTDLSTQRLTVIENGRTKYVWPISSGRRGFATKTGTFKPQWASRMWYSRQYEYAPMPHAIFFHRGTAFHGTTATGMLGRPASHGCVRLAPSHAAALYKLVHRHSFVQTKVVVHNGSRRKRPEVAGGGRAERITLRSGARGARSARVRRGYQED